MGVDLGKVGGTGEDPHRGVVHREDLPPQVQRPRKVKDSEVDEQWLSPLGARLPGGRWLSHATWEWLHWTGLGAWIVLYALTGVLAHHLPWTGGWVPGFVLMWIWIGGEQWWDRSTKEVRNRRKREMKEIKGRLARGEDPVPAPQPAAVEAERVHVPRVTEAERALLRAVRRVETSERFERRDVVLVGEIVDVLSPLLVRVAAPDADARVRHDVETLAAEHLPRTVDVFLALPADYAREHRTASGRTPSEELRAQLDLLLTGCQRLRDAVLDADVSRQQAQSRYLESTFRPSELDL